MSRCPEPQTTRHSRSLLRWTSAALLTMLVLGSLMPAVPGEPAQAAADPWRRTADGWERIARWHPAPPAWQPAPHPLLVALLQVGVSAMALIALPVTARRSGPPGPA